MSNLPFRKRLSFWNVLKSNLKCAFCKEKNCRVRYQPERKRCYYCSGTRYIDECNKDVDKRFDKAFKGKWP